MKEKFIDYTVLNENTLVLKRFTTLEKASKYFYKDKRAIYLIQNTILIKKK